MSTANFRTSIGGFHRGDVVNFIEETSIAHEKTVRKLKEDSSKLQQQLAAALAERDALAAQLEQAQLALEAQDVPKQECGEQIQSSQPVSCEASRTAELDELELAAYRRAEAAERSAQQRANRLFRQVNHLVQDAAGKFAASSAGFSELGGQLQDSLQQLEASFLDLQLLLERTSETFSHLEPLSLTAEPSVRG